MSSTIVFSPASQLQLYRCMQSTCNIFSFFELLNAAAQWSFSVFYFLFEGVVVLVRTSYSASSRVDEGVAPFGQQEVVFTNLRSIVVQK